MIMRSIDKSEAQIEQDLITTLCSVDCNWTYRSDLKTQDQLWDNFRDKLNILNAHKLNHKPLSDKEFDQVKSYIFENINSTYHAAKNLCGEHGEFQICINCDDVSLGKVYLTVIDSKNLSKNISYEVINQCRFDKDEDDIQDRARRFDVTLLINGLPLIQIELKKTSEGFLSAYRQIIKYAKESKFKGLFGFVQMFVVSNSSNTRYFAANIDGNNPKMNEKFLTRWVDKDNNSVEELLEFAKQVLNSDMAYKLVSKYILLDAKRKTSIILRGYQIHAIEAIDKASQEGRSGFIWHTTGSGKTITSFVVAKILDELPYFDKTIFLVDRKDLNQQTFNAFDSYSQSADLEVDDTKNTNELIKKLKNHDKKVIITSIQKLQAVIRLLESDLSDASSLEGSGADSSIFDAIASKKVAFVVDECHRTVTPETKKELESLFNHSLWYGFTGTPIFAENKRAQKGNLPQTTAELFGGKNSTVDSCLHCYTIKDAMKDNSVLGFMIHGLGFRREYLEEIALDLELTSSTIDSLASSELEKQVAYLYRKRHKKDLYSDERHKDDVINYILNQSTSLFNLRAKAGEYFSALLTVESIQDAQEYYQLIKKFIEDGRISDRVKKLAPDFPKVAITYTVGENEEGALDNQDAMKEALNDYNRMFNTKYSLQSLDAYNSDLNNRLARKYYEFNDRCNQLDLVIVVDRLLTGFDAPCLSTIFIDRPPMKEQHLIQAFSRTNRIFNSSKKYGHIVTMQYPELYEKSIDQALSLYSKGGINDVSAPSYEEASKNLEKAIDNFKSLISSPEHMSSFLTSNDINELKTIANAYQRLDHALDAIQVYDEFKESDLGTTFNITMDEFKSYLGQYSNIIERIAELKTDDEPDEIELTIEYELECIKKVEVNFYYLLDLIQAQFPEDLNHTATHINEDRFRSLEKMVSDFGLGNNEAAQIIMSLINDLKQNPNSFVGKSASVEIKDRVDSKLLTSIELFAQKWSLDSDKLKTHLLSNSNQDFSNFITQENCNAYLAQHNISKLKYKSLVREALKNFKQKEIDPLMNYNL